LGPYPEAYIAATHGVYNWNLPAYDQESGNGNWSDFVALAQHGNLTNRNDVNNVSIPLVDVEKLIRLMAADALTSNVDCYETTGNNWGVYHNPETRLFEMIAHDFDMSWSMASQSLKVYLLLNPMKDYSSIQRFQEYLKMLMVNVLNSTAVTERIANLSSLFVNEVQMDTTYQLQFHFGSANDTLTFFEESVQMLNTFVQNRYIYLLKTLEYQ